MNNQTPAANSTAIDVRNLTISYGPVPALLDISVQIPAGKLIGIIAPTVRESRR